jgi:NhaP-type Na+/H+ or K+/H+ antiporter
MMTALVYIVLGTIMKVYNWKYTHESGLIMLLTGIVSGIVYLTHCTFIPRTLGPEVLLYFCLPLILFAEAFNMHRKQFYSEFLNSVIYGLLMVFVTFCFHLSFNLLMCKIKDPDPF